jgi:hypothetical protein
VKVSQLLVVDPCCAHRAHQRLDLAVKEMVGAGNDLLLDGDVS